MKTFDADAPTLAAAAGDAAGDAAPDEQQPALPFPVVGIGCSAGGLEALEKFFAAVPADAGMAYVVVQHLAPDYPSALPEILQRATTLPVAEARQDEPVEPGRVYVIAPNTELLLRDGCLRLQDLLPQRGLRLPVDAFLRSLAADQHALAVGVVLSGMGSDGLFGLRAVKDGGGLTLAQDPASAQSDSMPRHAIEAGVADVVGLPGELPARIAQALHDVPATARQPAADADGLEAIVSLLRTHGGHDFSLYKPTTLKRRIERRMALHQTGTSAEYLRYLASNPQEYGLLFKELLIGVTSFFRDPAAWDAMRGKAFPALFARAAGDTGLRAWVPACSTGEEAYTLAICFLLALAESGSDARFTLQIYATDLDADAIEKARKAVFPRTIANDVPPEVLARFFVDDEGGGYRVCSEIRQMVVFAPQNIIADPPFTRLDLLCCRNLLIYLQPQLQKKLLPLFHYALNPDGCLLLGNAETVGTFGNLFEAIDAKARLYQRLEPRSAATGVEFPSGRRAPRGAPEPAAREDGGEDLGLLTARTLQQHYTPAAVLVNAQGDILYISGRTGNYLEPAAGKVNINLHAMAREGLREALAGALQQALAEGRTVEFDGLRVGSGGEVRSVDVSVCPLDAPAALRNRLLVVFRDARAPAARARGAASAGAPARQGALQQELQLARAALQATQERMQAALEELKSANEELQSTNEELQSANEELTSSKEEMQSLNEELQTVNAELQAKVDDFTWVRNDLTNLLNSTEIATIFLDDHMRLRRFTTHATRLFKLIPGDVGRPLTHVVTELDYPELQQDAESVLRTLSFIETQARTHADCWYRVRIMPYRTLDNHIDGVVITFIDITEIKRLETLLHTDQPAPAAAEETP